MSLKETEKALSRSQRTIQKLVQEGRIKTERTPREGRVAEVIYFAKDVLHVARETPAKTVIPISKRQAVAKSEKLSPDQRLVEKCYEMIDTLLLSANPTPWLTIEQAAKLSGLSPAFIKLQIELLKIRAIRAGLRKTWRVQRASLEAFTG